MRKFQNIYFVDIQRVNIFLRLDYIISIRIMVLIKYDALEGLVNMDSMIHVALIYSLQSH